MISKWERKDAAALSQPEAEAVARTELASCKVRCMGVVPRTGGVANMLAFDFTCRRAPQGAGGISVGLWRSHAHLALPRLSTSSRWRHRGSGQPTPAACCAASRRGRSSTSARASQKAACATSKVGGPGGGHDHQGTGQALAWGHRVTCKRRDGFARLVTRQLQGWFSIPQDRFK